MKHAVKNPTNRLFVAAGLAVLLGAAYPATAYFGMDRASHRMAHISEELDLDAEQQASLAELQNLRAKEKNQRLSNRKQLRELVKAEQLDTAAVEKLAADMAAGMEAKIVTTAEQMHSFRQSLSTEQQARWDAMEARRKNHRSR